MFNLNVVLVGEECQNYVHSDRPIHMIPSPTEMRNKANKSLPHFGKKSNLVIDTEMINSEESQANRVEGPLTSLSEGNARQKMALDLSQMRMLLGSEVLVREKISKSQ